jgi:hypothetical protein
VIKTDQLDQLHRAGHVGFGHDGGHVGNPLVGSHVGFGPTIGVWATTVGAGKPVGNGGSDDGTGKLSVGTGSSVGNSPDALVLSVDVDGGVALLGCVVVVVILDEGAFITLGISSATVSGAGGRGILLSLIMGATSNNAPIVPAVMAATAT